MRLTSARLLLVGLALVACGGGGAQTSSAPAAGGTEPATAGNAGAGAAGAGNASGEAGAGAAGGATGGWLSDAQIVVPGDGVSNMNCHSAVCQHNDDTDLMLWNGSYFLVHRSAVSHTLGPNSALYVYQSPDGQAFSNVAIIPASAGRDLRDPHFYTLGGDLFIKAVTRLPVSSTRDSNVDSISVAFRSVDGVSWASAGAIGPEMLSFWRPKEHNGSLYLAAYSDGDQSVTLFSSSDGLAWARGADIYTVSADTPLETELLFFPSGELLALVRLDGTDTELLGDSGRLRTKVCIATPPYDTFTCPSEIEGARFDGPLGFFWQGRVLVVARKHLPPMLTKRTALYELSGDFVGGNLTLKEWGELPSAGDTSYAGLAMLDDQHALVSWYASNLQADPPWDTAMLGATNIWTGVIDLSMLR